VKKLILFGSRARGDFKEASDYDFAFIWHDGHGLAWPEFTSRLHEKNPRLNTLDLIRLDKVSDEFKSRILSEGQLLYEAKIDE